MKFYPRTHKGHIRKGNEDSLHAGVFYAVVADGMGGHNAGDVASRILVDHIKDFFESKNPNAITSKHIKKCLFDANKKIWSNAKRNPKRKGMGTTATLAVFKKNKVFIGHVGDSRAYLFSNQKLTQITKDHSYVQQLIDSGEITATQASYHPHRNVITRAMGTNIDVKIDFYVTDIAKGDIVLLCSDGLISCVSDDDISSILSQNIESAADKLIDAALNCGGQDNISVVLALVEGGLV